MMEASRWKNTVYSVRYEVRRSSLLYCCTSL